MVRGVQLVLLDLSAVGIPRGLHARLLTVVGEIERVNLRVLLAQLLSRGDQVHLLELPLRPVDPLLGALDVVLLGFRVREVGDGRFLPGGVGDPDARVAVSLDRLADAKDNHALGADLVRTFAREVDTDYLAENEAAAVTRLRRDLNALTGRARVLDTRYGDLAVAVRAADGSVFDWVTDQEARDTVQLIAPPTGNWWTGLPNAPRITGDSLHGMNPEALTDQLEEVSAGYAAANDIDRTPDWLVLKLQEDVGELHGLI